MTDINYLNERKRQLMFKCDTNAKHVRWEDVHTNPRGESLKESSKHPNSALPHFVFSTI